MTSPRELARVVAIVADDLDARGYRAAGVVRQAAQLLATVDTPTAGECPVCGGAVVQPVTGRRRVYCSTACRNRSRNARERGGWVA